LPAYRRLAPLAALMLLVAACRGDERPVADSARTAADGRCLAPPPLLGLRLGDSVGAVGRVLGQPVAMLQGPVGKNGARIVTYRFPRADVYFLRGRVERIVATERGGWPRGLAVGSSLDEVERFAKGNGLRRAAAGNAIEIQVCPDDWARLHLVPSSSGRRVGRVELLATGPAGEASAATP
jgi:hypothetical protein